MKRLILLAFLSVSTLLNAQIFHVDIDSAVLYKNTDQSPAHWYIEIFNDAGVDTMLRWKAHFNNVPSQWVITFEDQTAFHNPVLDGDSADFAFPVTGTFPQKLIIGAFTNNTPDDATVYFEIYDPYAPQFRDTIYFIFHITQGTNSLYDLEQAEIIKFSENNILIINDVLTDFNVLDASGRLVLEANQTSNLDVSALKGNEMYFFEIIQGKNRYLVKWMR